MIEMGKEYRTRDGREVRIYAVDGGGPWPVHGATLAPNIGWDISIWESSGQALFSSIEHKHDLIEVKPKITRTYWLVHLTAWPFAYVWTEDPRAKLSPMQHCAITGPHSITFTEGEGLATQELKAKRRDLIRAAALIVAEIERIDRVTLKPKGDEG